MIPQGLGFKSIVAINVQFLMAVGLAAAAYAMWPESLEWWGFRVVASFLYLIASVSFAKGCTEVIRHIRRDIQIARMKRDKREARPDKLADRKTLKRNGVI